jgi:hypothetical protein
MIIIRINKKKLQESDELKYKKIIEMSAMDFLKLTTDADTRENLFVKRRQILKDKGELANFSSAKAYASMPYLVVDQANRVTEHEGRNRCLAALNPKQEFLKSKAKKNYISSNFFQKENFENPDATIKVELKSNHRNIEYLKSQLGEPDVVSLQSAKSIERKFSLEDPAGLGDEEIVFSTIVHKAGTPIGNGRFYQEDYVVKDAAKDAAFFIGHNTYHGLYDHFRQTKGWPESEHYSHHGDVAKATDELVNRVYDIQDDKGPLEFKMKTDNWYRAGFARDAVGDIVIKKK